METQKAPGHSFHSVFGEAPVLRCVTACRPGCRSVCTGMWGSWGGFRLGRGKAEMGPEQEVQACGAASLPSQCCAFLISWHRYDPRHNRWFQIQSLQQEHADLSVCVVGRYIYAVAGRDYHNDLNAVERYDPATNCWAYVAPLKREVRKKRGLLLPNFLPQDVQRVRGPGVKTCPRSGKQA